MTEERVLEALRSVIDPEVGINIVDLGLVYGVGVDAGAVRVTLTMTTRACPLGDYVRETAEAAVRQALGTGPQVDIELVWDPPWSPDMMSATAKAQLGWR